jgi:hypothetical protein
VRKKIVIIAFAVVVLVSLTVLSVRPPSKWSSVALGMSRSNVYSLLGEPDRNNESTKGGVRWGNNAIVGRWEFDVFFHDDDTVGTLGRRWLWNWW